jgi:hypothetical protein
VLTDKVRGIYKTLNSDNQYSEGSIVTALRSFGADGFSIGTQGNINNSGSNFVAWNWKANGSGSSNTNGSITSTVSANTDAGFSIVSYTGTGSNATIGHGLSSAPEMVMTKRRDSSGDWDVWHTGLGDGTKYMVVTTQAALTASNIWNSTVPSSTVVSLGTHSSNNASSGTYIAYCFHSVDGYSKVGSYTGNSNADGTFVYTGFRPAFIMVKRYDSTGHWEIHDTKRDAINQSQMARLFPNYSNGESDDDGWDILSNGFKLRTTHSSTNAGSLIYLAFAETPFKYSNAR